MHKILQKKDVAPNTSFFRIEAGPIARKIKAGQFVIIRLHEKGERIPLSYCGVDPQAQTIDLLVQAVGKTTFEMTAMKEGDSIQDMVGPLGVPAHAEKYGTAVLIGGGFGSGALLPIGRALKAEGNRIVSIIGARSRDLILMEKEMSELADKLYVTTDDGSYALKGMVTDALKDVMEEERPGVVVAIGPVPMMRAVSNMTKPAGIKTFVSLNPIMVDASGMCGVCRVSVGGQTKFACVDGPDFDGHQVDFDELTKRLRSYLDQEKTSLDLYRQKCGKC